jgi:ABC-type amino acid transport substrate-binding protein
MRIFTFSLLAAISLALPATAQTLERIKQTGELKLGYRSDAAPLSFTDVQGKAAGYSPILCAGVAQFIANSLKMDDLSVTFVEVDTTDRFEKVASGEIDLLCGAATITLSRRELVDFSVPTYVDGTAVLLPVDASEDLRALIGKRIGVRRATTTLEALENTLSDAGVEAQIFKFADHNAGLEAIRNNEIDAYFADQSILYFLAVNDRDRQRFKVTGKILTVEKQGLAMARGDADFRLLVDSAIAEMFANGTMAELYQRAIPGAQPGQAIQAMHLLSPTIP